MHHIIPQILTVCCLKLNSCVLCVEMQTVTVAYVLQQVFGMEDRDTVEHQLSPLHAICTCLKLPALKETNFSFKSVRKWSWVIKCLKSLLNNAIIFEVFCDRAHIHDFLIQYYLQQCYKFNLTFHFKYTGEVWHLEHISLVL